MPSACVLLCPGNVIFKFTVRKQSCGKVMFSQACVKNSVHGGVCLSACWDTPPWRQTPSPRSRHPSLEADTSLCSQTPPLEADTPPPGGRHPLGRHPPLEADPPPGYTPPWRQNPPSPSGKTATAADGTHLAGMHSSCKHNWK